MNISENLEHIEPMIERVISDQTTATKEKSIGRIEAYTAGSAAYHAGLPRKANPYTELMLRAEWSDGWFDARKDDENPKPHTSLWESVQNEFDTEENE